MRDNRALLRALTLTSGNPGSVASSAVSKPFLFSSSQFISLNLNLFNLYDGDINNIYVINLLI